MSNVLHRYLNWHAITLFVLICCASLPSMHGDDTHLELVSVQRITTLKTDMLTQRRARMRRVALGALAAGVGAVGTWYAYHNWKSTRAFLDDAVPQDTTAVQPSAHLVSAHERPSFLKRVGGAVEYGALLGIAGVTSTVGMSVLQRGGTQVKKCIEYIRAYVTADHCDQYATLVASTLEALEIFAEHIDTYSLSPAEEQHYVTSFCLSYRALVDAAEHFLAAIGVRAQKCNDAFVERWVRDEHNNVVEAINDLRHAVSEYVKQRESAQLHEKLALVRGALQRLHAELVVKKII